MKKFIGIILAAALTLTCAAAFGAGVSVKLNGEPLDMRDAVGNEVSPFIEDGTTYVPLRAIAAALNVEVSWDGETRTVFIGSRGGEAEAGENVNIFINEKKFIPRDVNGKEVAPIIRDGTTYLPVRAIAQAFAKKVSWDGETSSVLISDSAEIDTEKTYKISAQGTKSVITPASSGSGSALEAALFSGKRSQLWRFVPVEGEQGFYQIINEESGCAMDVSGQSRTAGAKILQYTAGTGDNQKFMLTDNGDGSYKLYAKNSMLPFENSAGEIKQSSDRQSSVQNWVIEEAAPSERAEAAAYKKLTVKGGNQALTYSLDQMTLTAEAYGGGDNQKWVLAPTAEGYYAVNTKEGGRSADVANNSTKEDDPIITYASSADDNQRWIFEKQQHGGYKIKSVSSGLYMAVKADGSVVQNGEGSLFDVADAD